MQPRSRCANFPGGGTEQRGDARKYVSIVRLAPGVDNVTRALEVFGKHGTTEGTEVLYACIDGKTFVTISDTDDPDIAGTSTYAPFFESTVIPVVDVAEAWTTAMMTAIANMSE